MKIRLRLSVILLALALSCSLFGSAGAVSGETIHSTEEKNIIKQENNGNIDLSAYTDSGKYHVETIIPTKYGTVLYFWPLENVHGGKNPSLRLLREDGSEVNLSEPVSRESPWNYPAHDNISLSEDGKTLRFSVSFAARREEEVDGKTVVLHDAGIYYYKADLETGKTLETKFEPFDTIGEDVISTWAKPEVEKAIALGFVPLSFRENYKRNITRGEFAELAMFFLSVQYGYQCAATAYPWSDTGHPDDEFFKDEFLDAYCGTKKDRNGNAFQDIDGKDYVYDNPACSALPLIPEFADTKIGREDTRFIGIAYWFGIVNGTSDTTFEPDKPITRQEAAAMLMRVYKNYAAYESSGSSYRFADDAQIDAWAKADVYSIQALEVMQGVEENVFAPTENYTIEQAILTFWRLYDTAPVSRKQKNITPLLDYKFESEHGLPRSIPTSFIEQFRQEYDGYILVYGYQQYYHSQSSKFKIYIFDKSGGMLCTDVSNDTELSWQFDVEKAALTVYIYYDDTFCLHNKLNGNSKVYDKGTYKVEYDVATRMQTNFERVE